ncbi:MAG TPA: hypothetical protein VK570_15765, partial [Rubrivivax sp.]|nr:hypothetical protein [Rubrivivax sp.]
MPAISVAGLLTDFIMMAWGTMTAPAADTQDSGAGPLRQQLDLHMTLFAQEHAHARDAGSADVPAAAAALHDVAWRPEGIGQAQRGTRMPAGEAGGNAIVKKPPQGTPADPDSAPVPGSVDAVVPLALVLAPLPGSDEVAIRGIDDIPAIRHLRVQGHIFDDTVAARMFTALLDRGWSEEQIERAQIASFAWTEAEDGAFTFTLKDAPELGEIRVGRMELAHFFSPTLP